MTRLPDSFNTFPQELKDDILRKGIVKVVPKGVELIREGQFIQVVPLVLTGLVNVLTRYEDRELLLYYIRPEESCIMSFFGVLRDETSRITARTEADSELLLLPSDTLREWLLKFPALHLFFHQLNNLRYLDLLDTIHEVLFEHLDGRILNFLREKARLTGNPFIRIRHRDIADALGTSREAISRVTKKLEHEKKIAQYPDGIEVRL